MFGQNDYVINRQWMSISDFAEHVLEKINIIHQHAILLAFGKVHDGEPGGPGYVCASVIGHGAEVLLNGVAARSMWFVPHRILRATLNPPRRKTCAEESAKKHLRSSGSLVRLLLCDIFLDIIGTSTIEGGTLSEEETRFVLDLAPGAVAEEEQRRALNIKAAYQLVLQTAARANWRMDVELMRSVHATITDNLTHPFNPPGGFRDNPKGIVTHVGDATHGGRCKPPQHGADIERLLAELAAWHDRLVDRGVPALVRAPLVHYYFELIHPFWDGNGRVGRLLEATLLLAAGFEYAPYTLSRFYLDQLDRYVTFFNTCRKAAGKGLASPNTPFVAFHLEGMLVGINRLHDRVNGLVSRLLFEAEVIERYRSKELNARQFAILSQLLDRPESMALADLRKAPWYLALYARLTDKTRQRDLKRLRELQLVEIDSDQRIRPRFTSEAAGSGPRRMR